MGPCVSEHVLYDVSASFGREQFDRPGRGLSHRLTFWWLYWLFSCNPMLSAEEKWNGLSSERVRIKCLTSTSGANSEYKVNISC